MTKIKNRVKHLFTKEVFRGENDGFEFLIYSFLIERIPRCLHRSMLVFMHGTYQKET